MSASFDVVNVGDAPLPGKMTNRKPIFDALEALPGDASQCLVITCDNELELRSVRNSIHGRFSGRFKTSSAEAEDKRPQLVVVPAVKA
jgi:hypothetical protein